MLLIQVHCPTIRHTWEVRHEETTRIKQGSHTYCMRHWLRLYVAQPIISSYLLPMSMLSPGGINRNTNDGNTSLKQLSMLTKWPLMSSCWYFVKELSNNECCWDSVLDLFSMRKWRMWFNGRECAWSCNLPLSFCKCRFIGISLAIASIPSDGDILNAPNIHKVAFLYSFPNVFNG